MQYKVRHTRIFAGMSHKVEECLNAWLNGEERAYKGVFEHYYPKLLAAGYRLRKNSEECEELAMNVLLKIWQHKAGIQHILNLEDYLYGMLRQEISRLARKKIIQTSELNNLDQCVVTGNFDYQISFKELERQYTIALTKIPAKRLEIFLLSRDHGLTYQEISRQHHISVNTVRNHIASALKLLKSELHEYSDSLPFIVLFTLLKH